MAESNECCFTGSKVWGYFVRGNGLCQKSRIMSVSLQSARQPRQAAFPRRFVAYARISGLFIAFMPTFVFHNGLESFFPEKWLSSAGAWIQQLDALTKPHHIFVFKRKSIFHKAQKMSLAKTSHPPTFAPFNFDLFTVQTFAAAYVKTCYNQNSERHCPRSLIAPVLPLF